MKGLVEVAGVQENPFGPSAEQGQTVTKSLCTPTHTAPAVILIRP